MKCPIKLFLIHTVHYTCTICYIMLWEMHMWKLMAVQLECDVISHHTFLEINELPYCTSDPWWKWHWRLIFINWEYYFITVCCWLIDCMWVRDLTAPMHLGLIKWALCALYQNHRSPVSLPKLQMAPKLILLISSGSRKKEPRCMCLSEARASHSQRMWAEVSFFTPPPAQQTVYQP